MEKEKLIDEIITMDFYEIQQEDEPKKFEKQYRKQLEQLPVDVLQKYIGEEITSEELYDSYISKL